MPRQGYMLRSMCAALVEEETWWWIHRLSFIKKFNHQLAQTRAQMQWRWQIPLLTWIWRPCIVVLHSTICLNYTTEAALTVNRNHPHPRDRWSYGKEIRFAWGCRRSRRSRATVLHSVTKGGGRPSYSNTATHAPVSRSLEHPKP